MLPRVFRPWGITAFRGAAPLAVLALLCAIVLLILPGCQGKTDSSAKADSTFNQAMAFYRQCQIQEALPLFTQVVAQRPNDAEALSWLAETQRRLGNRAEASEAAHKALQIDSCNTFAHTVLAYNFNPMYGQWDGANRDSAWQHLLIAMKCDSTDGNVWLAAWTESIYRGDTLTEKTALERLMSTGFLTNSILAYNRWALQYLPEKAVLITNGDMDTYPAVALQAVKIFAPTSPSSTTHC